MKIDLKKMRPKNFNSYLYNSVEKLAKNVEKGSGNKNINKCPVCKSLKRKWLFFKRTFRCRRFTSCNN